MVFRGQRPGSARPNGSRHTVKGERSSRLASLGSVPRYCDDARHARHHIFGGVGLSYIEGTVSGPVGEQSVRFLIDSGAVYSLLPEHVWRAIGLVPKREMDFALADGTTVRRAVTECHLSLPQGEGHTPVILGEPGDEQPLLGVVTLEILGLVFDPFHRTLHPMRALLV